MNLSKMIKPGATPKEFEQVEKGYLLSLLADMDVPVRIEKIDDNRGQITVGNNVLSQLIISYRISDGIEISWLKYIFKYAVQSTFR